MTWLKRAFDLLFGTLAVVGLVPLMLAIALAIKLNDRGGLTTANWQGMGGMPTALSGHGFPTDPPKPVRPSGNWLGGTGCRRLPVCRRHKKSVEERPNGSERTSCGCAAPVGEAPTAATHP